MRRRPTKSSKLLDATNDSLTSTAPMGLTPLTARPILATSMRSSVSTSLASQTTSSRWGPVSPPPRPSLVISCGGLATSASTPETAGTSPRGTPNSESWRVATTAIPFTFVSFVNEGTSLNRDIEVVCRWKTSSGTLLFQSSHTSGHEPSHPAHRFIAR